MPRLEIPALLLCGAATSRSSSSSSTIFRRSSSLCVSSYSKPHLHHQQLQIHYHCHSKPLLVVCNNSQSKGDHELRELSDDDDDYFKAVILMAETIRCHQIQTQLFYEDYGIKWRHTTKLLPLSDDWDGFLSLYHAPTIFLKVFNYCDGDRLLPIVLGEGVVESLIRLSLADEVSAYQFQLMGSIVGKPGYHVKWVNITKRVDKPHLGNATICFHKPGAEDIKVDARLKDAIIFAKQFRSPIYVSKQIVQKYGLETLRNKAGVILRDKESIYEVYLDSAIDGPDILGEEFDLVSKIYLAVKEERYTDAAIWREKLLKLYTSSRNNHCKQTYEDLRLKDFTVREASNEDERPKDFSD